MPEPPSHTLLAYLSITAAESDPTFLYGVSRNRADGKTWRARIKGLTIGTFPTAEAAAQAYDEVAFFVFGEWVE